MKFRSHWLIVLASVSALTVAASEVGALTLLGSFNPSGAGSLCSVGYSGATASVWVYECSGSNVQSYSTAGVFQASIARPGESTNDVDIEIAPVGFTLGSTAISAGSLLFVNGETGPADIYAVDVSSGSILTTLNTGFGVSHVVGGAYHPARGTIFLVQDSVPAAADNNRIAEIDPTTGAVLNAFDTTDHGGFTVFFGDMEVHTGTGNLFVVSSDQSGVLELTADGAFVALHALPAGVVSLSGIALDEANGEMWVSGIGGMVWRLGGIAVPEPALAPLFGVAALAIRARRFFASR